MSSKAVVVLVLLAGCGVSARPEKTDAGTLTEHTVEKRGALHMPGLKDPNANCVACHGARLEGGEGPSCTKCHGKVW